MEYTAWGFRVASSVLGVPVWADVMRVCMKPKGLCEG